MTNTMSRRVLAAALTLGALGAIGEIASGAATAEAAPRYSANPFDGFYYGYVPGVASSLGRSWPIRINSHGAIAGGEDAGQNHIVGQELYGKVDSSGQMSVKGTDYALNFAFKATVSLDAGNVIGTTTTGESFVWYRQ
jgi:hypothetical protein